MAWCWRRLESGGHFRYRVTIIDRLSKGFFPYFPFASARGRYIIPNMIGRAEMRVGKWHRSEPINPK